LELQQQIVFWCVRSAWLLEGVWIEWLDLLTPYAHHSELQAINYRAIADLHILQFTVTYTSVLSLLHSPLAVSW
jgi:hypothetical protein